MAEGRGIIWEPRASDAADEAGIQWPRGADVVEIIEFALMRDPNAGKPISESGNLRVLTYQGARSIGQPTAVVTYEVINDDQLGENIVIHQIVFSEAKSAGSRSVQ